MRRATLPRGKILVLGGSGFVGRSVVTRLARRRWAITVPTRSRARSRALLVEPRVELVEADVHDERTLVRLLQGCAAAINLVGIVNEKRNDGSGFAHAHVALAEKLVRACRSNGVERVIQMSALKADAERAPSHYLRTKGQAERVIASSGLAYTIFRPSTIFGPDDSFINRFARLLRRLPTLPLPRADARFAPAYVDDVADAFATALESPESVSATYELCGPDIYSLEEIVRYVRGVLGVRRIVMPVPDALGRVQAWIGEYLLPGKPISLDNFATLGVASVCSADGFAALGIKPQSLAAVVPTYLAGAADDTHALLTRLRQRARRG